MKEMALKDIQRISLEIMDYIHSFCVKNDIRYSLGFGTLIGAIRHKGFIPWDDDMDIFMLRSDYERFLSLFQNSERFKLFAPRLPNGRGNSYIAFARVCEMVDTLAVPARKCFAEESGIWVDIFPVDNLPEAENAFRYCIKKMTMLFNYLVWRRGALDDYSDYMQWTSKLRLLFRKTIFHGDPIKLAGRYDRICQLQAPESSSYIGQIAFMGYSGVNRFRFPKSVFTHTIEVDFEGRRFLVMNGYDECLRTIYGDYMQLPPPEQQKQSHSFHKYYWRSDEAV